MFTFLLHQHFRPQDHGWELIEACRPGSLAPPSQIWLRWNIPYRFPQALTLFAPNEKGSVYAGYLDEEGPEKMTLDQLRSAIS